MSHVLFYTGSKVFGRVPGLKLRQLQPELRGSIPQAATTLEPYSQSEQQTHFVTVTYSYLLRS